MGCGFQSGGESSRALIWRIYGRRYGWQRWKCTEGSGWERRRRDIRNTKPGDTVAVNTIVTGHDDRTKYGKQDSQTI